MKQQKLKAKSLEWINSKIRHFGNEEAYWEDFYKFKCREFFVGETLAELNKELYYENIEYINRKIRQLKLLKERKKE